MARSNLIWLVLAVLVPAEANAQSTPVPTDIPWSVNVSSGTMTGDDGMLWSADGGVYLNDQARELEKQALKEVQDQNAELQKKLIEAQSETEANRITPEAWAGIATSIVGTVGAAIAAVVAATQKH